jgi:hypothetical protein
MAALQHSDSGLPRNLRQIREKLHQRTGRSMTADQPETMRRENVSIRESSRAAVAGIYGLSDGEECLPGTEKSASLVQTARDVGVTRSSLLLTANKCKSPLQLDGQVRFRISATWTGSPPDSFPSHEVSSADAATTDRPSCVTGIPFFAQRCATETG